MGPTVKVASSLTTRAAESKNILTFASSESSDQPGHHFIIIRIFAHMKKSSMGPEKHTKWFRKANDQNVRSQYWAENGLAGFNVWRLFGY